MQIKYYLKRSTLKIEYRNSYTIISLSPVAIKLHKMSNRMDLLELSLPFSVFDHIKHGKLEVKSVPQNGCKYDSSDSYSLCTATCSESIK